MLHVLQVPYASRLSIRFRLLTSRQPSAMGGNRRNNTGKTVHAIASKASSDMLAAAKGEERPQGKG